MDDIIRQLNDNNIPYKKERKLATIYIIDGDKVETKEEMCDVITVNEGTGGKIVIKY